MGYLEKILDLTVNNIFGEEERINSIALLEKM